MREIDATRPMDVRLAVIGGSGLYSIEGARTLEEREVPTPWGLPSDALAIVEIAGEKVAFLPRHGRGHRLLPSEVPSLANIWALKSLGVRQILSVSAVGSLSEAVKPGDFVLPDDLVDKTARKPSTFFGSGIVGHVSLAEPFCPGMRARIGEVIARHRHPFHPSGTYVCMEGPSFSTRAESRLHKTWGASLIGMTAMPEARLAREAEICYATIAMVTDWDCWKEDTQDVTVQMVLRTMRENTAAVRRMIPDLVVGLQGREDCSCRHAAEHAIMTDPAVMPLEQKHRLALFYGRYWKDNR